MCMKSCCSMLKPLDSRKDETRVFQSATKISRSLPCTIRQCCPTALTQHEGPFEAAMIPSMHARPSHKRGCPPKRLSLSTESVGVTRAACGPPRSSWSRCSALACRRHPCRLACCHRLGSWFDTSDLRKLRGTACRSCLLYPKQERMRPCCIGMKGEHGSSNRNETHSRDMMSLLG